MRQDKALLKRAKSTTLKALLGSSSWDGQLFGTEANPSICQSPSAAELDGISCTTKAVHTSFAVTSMNSLLSFRPAATLLGRTAFLKLNAPHALRVSAPARSLTVPRILAMANDNKASGTVKWYVFHPPCPYGL